MRYVVREDNRVGMLHKLCFEEGGILCRGHCVMDSECEERVRRWFGKVGRRIGVQDGDEKMLVRRVVDKWRRG